ncbi:cationic amino acid transporter 8 [Perilla frutescens var. hirtella]|nr:cationic amino acid transporter 8 [Perilla frutescens var. hirtella]KAH6817409.1 cationic amino acid transporter 8 [Perilla frutescens var. frutescens]
MNPSDSATVSTGKSYWRFSKHDFFPEPTFQNSSTYLAALSKTPHRLTDHLLGRSSDADELIKAKKQSEHEMKKCLTCDNICRH